MATRVIIWRYSTKATTRTMTAAVLSGFVGLSGFTGKTVGRSAPGRIGAGVEIRDLHPGVEIPPAPGKTFVSRIFS
ncbi:hypothetical protein GCM10027187_50550 [Streptosporangium sandarakinum]